MKLKGNIKLIREIQQISDKFKKREFVVTENSGQYPQHIIFQATQDRVDLLDGFNIGDSVEVKFNLRGREWTNPEGEVKYFNSMDCWALSKEEQTEQIPEAIKQDGEDDDLPF